MRVRFWVIERRIPDDLSGLLVKPSTQGHVGAARRLDSLGGMGCSRAMSLAL